MKKAILLLTLCTSFCVALKAQPFGGAGTGAKPYSFTDTAKVKYNKVVIISPEEYGQLVTLSSAYRNLTTYIPFMQPTEKLQEQANVDNFLNTMAKKFKLDSIKVIPPKPASK